MLLMDIQPFRPSMKVRNKKFNQVILQPQEYTHVYIYTHLQYIMNECVYIYLLLIYTRTYMTLFEPSQQKAFEFCILYETQPYMVVNINDHS